MKRLKLFLSGVLLFSSLLISAQDSCHVKISLITLSPGDEIYTVFGHSGLRIKDSSSNQDLIYGYGTFDFNEPNFLMKFINGKLLYYLSNEDYLPFINYYRNENRTIIEQELNFTCEEKERILKYLYNNLQGENKFYKYDFIYDNCTTRLRDLIESNTSRQIRYKRIVKSDATFRGLLHSDLNYHDHQWLKLGIDILLGSGTDRKMSDKQVMFLPDYLMTTIGTGLISNSDLVLKKNILSTGEGASPNNLSFANPFPIFFLVALLLLVLTFLDHPRINNILERVDALLFFLFGLTGFILIYLWSFSDQLNYRNNFNFLWGIPTHLIVSFLMFKNRAFIRNYLKATSILYALLLLVWFYLPQQLNYSLIPLIILLMVRCAVRGFKLDVKSLYGKKDIKI